MNHHDATRRRLLTGSAALLATTAQHVRAQDGRPIEWVVGYAAGGGSDVVARTVADAMGRTLGATIIVNNKPGAATNIAADYAAKTKDVNHMLLSADFATLAANPFLFPKLPYDAEKDFAPIGLLARFPLILVVGPNVPAKDWKEFAAWVKASPDAVGYASAGIGSPHHLAAELLRERSGLKLQHVPYRGAAPAVQDLIGGQVSFGLIDTASVQQHIASGKLRAIGVASPARLKAMPDIPTLSEQGLAGFEAYAWQGLVAPAGASPQWVAKLNKSLVDALDSAPVRARFDALALEALPGTPKQMADYAKLERERWGKLIQANNIRLE